VWRRGNRLRHAPTGSATGATTPVGSHGQEASAKEDVGGDTARCSADIRRSVRHLRSAPREGHGLHRGVELRSWHCHARGTPDRLSRLQRCQTHRLGSTTWHGCVRSGIRPPRAREQDQPGTGYAFGRRLHGGVAGQLDEGMASHRGGRAGRALPSAGDPQQDTGATATCVSRTSSPENPSLPITVESPSPVD